MSLTPLFLQKASLPAFNPRKSTNLSGFTLLELLVVITIIGILSAILFLGVGRVRESARVAQCGSNMRQIGIALTLYAQDHKGYYPVMGGPAHNFAERLVQDGYVDKRSGVFTCPSDPGVTQDLVPAGKEPRSYAYVSPAMAPNYNPYIARSRFSIKNLGRVAMVTEHPSEVAEIRTMDTMLGCVVGSDIVQSDSLAQRESGHNFGKRYFLFFDGHIAFLAPIDCRYPPGTKSSQELWGFLDVKP